MLGETESVKKITKEAYRKALPELELRLSALQRRARERAIPILFIFEGWSAAGKGTMAGRLIHPLDPRGFTLYTINPPTEDERLHPPLWRFWPKTPSRGRIAVFVKSWYRGLFPGGMGELPAGDSTAGVLRVDEINSFEEELCREGAIIIKYWLQISKKEQKKRLLDLQKDDATKWRVEKEDWRQNRRYDRIIKNIDDMLEDTDTEFAPWTIIDAHDRRHATIKLLETAAEAIERRVDREAAAAEPVHPQMKTEPVTLAVSVSPGESPLDAADLTLSLGDEEYRSQVEKCEKKLREIELELYTKRIPVVIVYEGWDAAGKGGNIKRLTERMDPRGYDVVPVAAPTDEEKSHHYLWRFWRSMPKGGHIAIFDRSWYGRVLVERVEGLCTEEEWRRAYREINEMEEQFVRAGAVVIKFFLHISREEQLRRFKERESVEYKKWKITPEDYRNRSKWEEYRVAITEMLLRTSTRHAPWHIIESENKHYARVKTMSIAIQSIGKALRKT
jgi:polyphosphate:AMP phosphotransferase